MSDRDSIEVDYCPECRVGWLDRVELGKIIERSDAGRSPRCMDPRDQARGPHGKNKRTSFLAALFD